MRHGAARERVATRGGNPPDVGIADRGTRGPAGERAEEQGEEHRDGSRLVQRAEREEPEAKRRHVVLGHRARRSVARLEGALHLRAVLLATPFDGSLAQTLRDAGSRQGHAFKDREARQTGEGCITFVPRHPLVCNCTEDGSVVPPWCSSCNRARSLMPRRRSELKVFAATLRRVRGERELAQGAMAAWLGVSPRTLSDWENSYSLPEAKERLHFLYAINDIDPDYVESFAELLGLRAHPAIAPLVGDDDGDDAVVAPPLAASPLPPESPAPPKATREELKAILDGAVREAADAIDVRASDLRRSVHAVLGALAEKGGSIDDARAALGAKEITRGKRSA